METKSKLLLHLGYETFMNSNHLIIHLSINS